MLAEKSSLEDNLKKTTEEITKLREELSKTSSNKDEKGQETDRLSSEVERLMKECKEQNERNNDLRRILMKCRNTIEGWLPLFLVLP